jgi:NADH-quinone oxidoreductase subunit M
VLHRVCELPVVAGLGTRFELVAQGPTAHAAFVDLLVALVAVGLAPVASHGPRTLATILRVIALTLVFVAVTDPVPLALLWALPLVVAARELRRIERQGTPAASRPFVRYQTLSLIAAFAGTLALLAGWTSLAAAAWLLAVAVREAALPVHGWLPAIAERAPLGLVVALVAPQPGVHAQLTVCGDLTGGELAHGFAAVGACTAVVGAMLGTVQADARRAAAWLLISQTGLVAFGLENASVVGRTGAVLSWQVMALAMSGFVMTIAALEARRGSLSLREPGGSFARTPRMAVAFLFLGFASVALPLTLGFVAEDLLVQGSVDDYPLVAFAVIVATALNGITVMRCFFVLFSGSRRHRGEHDLTRREAGALTVVMAVLLLGGLWPVLFVGTPADPVAPATTGDDR